MCTWEKQLWGSKGIKIGQREKLNFNAVGTIDVQSLSHVWLFATPWTAVSAVDLHCMDLHYLPEFAQTYVHWVNDAIQPSHHLSSHLPPFFSLSQHYGLFQWVGSSHQVAKILDLQLQHQSYQWIFRVDFL